MVSEAGVDVIGMNFYQHSSRYVTPACAAGMARVAGRAKLVGVFVDPGYSEVRAVLDAVPLDWLQFHGSEPPELCSAFGMPYIKAAGMSDEFEFAPFAERYTQAFAYLLDVHDTERHGGTGRTFDWRLWPESAKPLILAGGLTPDNVALAISTMRPWAVDVANGVEGETPGRKDPSLVAAFVEGVRRP